MIFGKIEYLNLLPFHLFLKRYLRHSAQKAAWCKKGNVPAKINRDFRLGRVDAAVISSVMSRGYRCSDLGIVAEGAVWSVLLKPGLFRDDDESNTSNLLAQVLGLEGEVIIGDKALKRYAQEEELLDLAEIWHQRTKLPFVFARLCTRTRSSRRIDRIAHLFFRNPIYIPYAILVKESRKRGLEPTLVKAYLKRIRYRLGWREKRALRRYFNDVRRL